MKLSFLRPSGVSVALALLVGGSAVLFAGPLNPPSGPVTSTAKTLAEIEPRIAINAANTPGDSDSVFAISQSGSYYLTADISVPTGKSGIKINNSSANNVTIDLNGFTIRGGPAGTLDGIRTNSFPGGTTLRIHNGAISSMAANGISVYAQTLDVSQVAAEFCGTDGISCSGSAITISQCRAFWNTGDGFHVTSSANISSCAAELNTGDGFEVGGGRIAGCTVASSGGRGIVASSNCQIADCSVTATLDGISIGSFCTVVRNKASSSNTHFAIHATGSSNRIDENDVRFAQVGVQVDAASGNTVIRNSATSNQTAFVVPAGNLVGPVVNTPAGVATAGAWANFAY